jgi:hypothetical protein
MPQPLKITGSGGGTLLIRHQARMLLHACPGGVVLEVEQVLRVPSQQSHPGVKVRTLEVIHSLKALLPHGVLLILNREKRDKQCCYSGNAVLAQGGEGNVRHPLNAGVRLATDDGPRPWFSGVEGYCHADLTRVQAMGHRQPATVDRSIPVIAKMEECIIWHSREPRAVLAHGTQSPILDEVEVGVIV